MIGIPIYQVDAFTDRLFAGNPAAVCPLEQWLPDRQMQQIAAENNLSETAFFVPKSEGYDLRWFTPVAEVDLCGHATLATAHVLFQHLKVQQETLYFYTKSGTLTVARQGEQYMMDFPVDVLEPALPPPVMLEALEVDPQEVLLGREDYLLILSSEAEVRQIKPDFAKLKRVNSRGVIVSAPGEHVDFVSRCFFPNYGVDEDPVTGSAHTTLTPYWAERLSKQELKAQQLSPRGGRLHCTMLGERVAIAGSAVTYLEGVIML
jgi:PhzF family phenazine biosynthesis protein